MVLGGDLIRLMRDGPESDLKAILDNFDVSRIVDLMGSTLLHYSAIAGNDSVTSYLLERGCNPDSQDVKGITPLILAIQHKHNFVIRTLLQANADIDVVTRSGRNALQLAFGAVDGLCTGTMKMMLERVRDDCSSRIELHEKLLKSGCQLYHAIFLKDCKLIRHMLDLGYSVDSKHPTYGYTALHIASSLVDLTNVHLLLRYGADVNALDCDLQTPLFYLYNYSVELTRDKLEILRIFLDLGVSLMTHTIRGFYQVGPSLSRACKLGIRRILKSNDIDFAAKDGFDDKTVLHYLAMNGNPGVAEELKPYLEKFDVSAVDRWGATPLYFATEEGNADMLEFLLENGADPNVRHNTFGYTPLCFAVLEFQADSADHYDRCTQLLLRYGADPQVTFTANTDDDLQLTIFDNALTTKTFGRVKLVVAHLAMLESIGVTLSELTYSKMQLHWIFKDYFESCRELLRKNVSGDVTFLELLTSKDKIVARHLRDENLLLKLTQISYKYKAKAYYPYYFNTLYKRISKLLRRMRLEDNATRGICAISQGRLVAGHLVVERIFTYLDNVSLLCLCEL